MMNHVKQISLMICVAGLVNSSAIAGESDWRPDYRSMVGAYYTNDYQQAVSDASTCLDKIQRVKDQTEKNVALDELIKYLNMMSGRNRQQQDYAQQELVLKCKLKANEARYADDSTHDYQITQIRKDLATCLVLQGKSKEAEAYLTKQEKIRKSDNLTGWKKDLDLLSGANKDRQLNNHVDPDKLCEYATDAVDDALSIKNTTEKEVAFNQIIQQLTTAEYKYKNDKDYLHEEKILKLLLKMQDTQAPGDDWGVGMGVPYQRTSTLQELVTCLVMEGKDDEAAEYNKTYKEETEKTNKNLRKYMKNVIEKVAPAVDDKENKPVPESKKP